jgi:D-arabinose 1-dehydrogenase-like Zn-dependent alcohol dehydrogenase
MAAATYRAFQAVGGGRLELVDRPVEAPAAGMVRVAVEACGVCHTDALTVEGGFPGMTYPRVPGHEAVGRVDALGAGVTRWKLGQRVGVGFLAGRCGECVSCRRGDFVNCTNQTITGVHLDGGYAEMMVASAHALVAIPDALQSADAAPLQCAGVTTFNALRKSAARPGELVAVQGVGGLGHLAIQFARLGGASVIVATASNPATFGPLLRGLGPKGQLIVVGAGPEPMTMGVSDLLFGEHSVAGQNTGSPIEIEDTLNFSLLQNIRARIERVPFERTPDAYARMLANQARFRMVIEMTPST